MLAEWLMENASPVIRYRTLSELIHAGDKKILNDTMHEVLALPQTQKRLGLLSGLNYNDTHGSPSKFLENVLPMLNDFGLYYGMDAFNNATKRVMEISNIVLDKSYDKLVAYPFLLRSKFAMNGLMDYAVERVHTIYDFTRHMDFDIYDDAANHNGVPKNFQDRPIIKPAIAYDTVSCGINIKVPLIYDIVLCSAIYDCVPPGTQAKINNIIEYIISPEYDVVVCGYGILPAPQKRYYLMGWDCKKPFNDGDGFSNENIHRLILYSNFPTAVESTWFQNAVDYLTQYRTERGTYLFPKEYLPEKDCNWVLGARMSLAENRRVKQWAEVESTFYMSKLLAAVK